MLGSSQNLNSPGESRIDKMRKFLSSPLLKKKPATLQSKTFGQPLETLAQTQTVPFIITRLCEYIQDTGLTQEGLFRISGNARSVERLRASFDRSGDAPLETEGDVSSAAALLKLFLRELPDPIIPLNMHSQFLNSVKDKEKEESISSLACLVDKLPLSNYCILKYLMHFLKKVSEKEDQNRMSASSLGIVFGPNLFRVTEDFVGLQEQSLTNQIVTFFIMYYQDIFLKEPIGPENVNSRCRQPPAMVASWPEAKGSSSSMLSSWSLGPLSIQMPSDDAYLPLCPVSYSMEHSLASSELDEPDFCSITSLESSKKELFSELRVCDSKGESVDLSSSFVMKNQSHPSEDFLKSGKVHESCHPSFSSSDSLVEAQKDHEISSDLLPFGKMSGYSHDDAEISVRIPDLNSKVTIDAETGQVSLDSHKSYPRGRRRHDHPTQKSKRRSHSELRPHFDNEDECNGNASFLTHSSKHDPLHNSTGSIDDNTIESRHSWPAFKKCHSEDITLSPLPQPLEVLPFSEASVSPSAFRSYLSHRNLHLDPSLPPSPPVEQEDLAVGDSFEDSTSCAKQLTKKVHAFKKKIKLFEENFEKLYGYKPTLAEKSNNITVKKMLAELNKAKRDLKQLKQEPSLWSQDRVSESLPQGQTRDASGNLSIEESVKEAMDYLDRHWKEEGRHEALEELSKEELIAEKVLIQKVLLNFESVHGRPTSKSHRELVRPLYDRYRSTKRLIARACASKDPADLQPILEHEAMSFPRAGESQAKPDDAPAEVSLHSSQVQKSVPMPHINFHELSWSELSAELNAAREEKRRIRKILREFEEQFKKENRRKIQREDKHCMEFHYTEYKNVKAKLKLLEALVAKHDHSW